MDEQAEHSSSETLGRGRLALIGIALEGAFIVVAAIGALLTGVRFWEAIHLNTTGLTLGIVATLPMIAVTLVLVRTSGRFFNQMRADFERVVSLFKVCTVADLFWISLSAGVGEEVLFRGFIQTYLGELSQPYLALVITSIVFGALHAVSVSYFIFATIVGLYLGGLYLWSDNLLIPIAAHFLYDFVALSLGTRFPTILKPSLQS